MSQSKPIIDAPLWQALERHQADLVDQLLYEGSHPDTRNFNGATPLTHAVEAFDLNMIETLLSHGADPNLANAFDTTPLMACCVGFPEGAHTLLHHGADPHKLNRFGQNPAAWAKRQPQHLLARLILNFDPTLSHPIEIGAKIKARQQKVADLQGAEDLTRMLAHKRQALTEALSPPAASRSPQRK